MGALAAFEVALEFDGASRVEHLHGECLGLGRAQGGHKSQGGARCRGFSRELEGVPVADGEGR